MTPQQLELYDLMLKRVNKHIHTSTMAKLRPELEAINILSNYLQVKLEKIWHPQYQSARNAFNDVMPIDAWGGNYCVEFHSTTKLLHMADKLGYPGLFFPGHKITWLCAAHVQCQIPICYAAYYDKDMHVAIVSFGKIINEGQLGPISNHEEYITKGKYMPLDGWDIIS